MTKEQQKALETANRRKFVNNIAIVAMTDILDQAENIRKTLDVKMRYQNYNRYIICTNTALTFHCCFIRTAISSLKSKTRQPEQTIMKSSLSIRQTKKNRSGRWIWLICS